MTAFAQDWVAHYGEALEMAKEGRPLILVFSGSDWCTPCIKLDRNIWRSEVFKAYAKENYVLYKADFPRKKINGLSEEKIKENRALAEKYNPKGHFPLILVLDGKALVLGSTGYHNWSPEEYIAYLNTLVK